MIGPDFRELVSGITAREKKTKKMVKYDPDTHKFDI